MLENLDDYLLRKMGTTEIPLAAYSRPNIALPAGMLEDPDHGFVNPSIQEEMIRRASHTEKFLPVSGLNKGVNGVKVQQTAR